MTFNLTVIDSNRESHTTFFDYIVLPLDSASNQDPSADAGDDQVVTSGDIITLDGGRSFDPDTSHTFGTLTYYAWTQTSGTNVTLTGASTVAPSFIAPAGLTSSVMLEFELTVSDVSGGSDTDTVSVSVYPRIGSLTIDGCQ